MTAIWKVKPILKWEIDSIQAVLDEEKEKQGKSDKIEQLSTECRKTKTKGLTLANHNVPIEVEANACNRPYSRVTCTILLFTAKRSKRHLNDHNTGNSRKKLRTMSNQPPQGKIYNSFKSLSSKHVVSYLAVICVATQITINGPNWHPASYFTTPIIGRLGR